MPDIRSELRRFSPHLLKAQKDNLNEADTCQRLVKFFEQVLGYDTLTDITSETQIKDKYVDFAVKIDGHIKFLIEAKAAGITLRDRHVEQAERYASQGNIRWVLLTNGIQWFLYHLTFDEGIEYDRVFSIDLSNDPHDLAPECIGILHKRAIKKNEHESFLQKRQALGPASIGRALMSENIVRSIRREIRKQEGLLIDEEDLVKSIHDMFTQEVREQIGPAKIKRNRRIIKSPSKATKNHTKTKK